LHFSEKSAYYFKTIKIMAEKLYGLYAVVSNKTVRAHENFYVRWKNKKEDVPGKEMVKTNRGWFLDGHNIDEKSTELWFQLTGHNRAWRPKKELNK
jgi:hypothetical protein